MSVLPSPSLGTQPRDHPRTIGWLGTSALAMGGSNQMVFLVGALIAAQGSGAVPILIAGMLLGWAAAPGWIELVLMWPKRVGGIAATCAEAFRPYSPVLANLTGVCYWWGWVPTCGFTAILSATALHEWFLPWIPVTPLAIAVVLLFAGINLLGVRDGHPRGDSCRERRRPARAPLRRDPDRGRDGRLWARCLLPPRHAVRRLLRRRHLRDGRALPRRLRRARLRGRRPATSARPRTSSATCRAPCTSAAPWPGCSSSSCRSSGSAPIGPGGDGRRADAHASARRTPRCWRAAPRPRRSGS